MATICICWEYGAGYGHLLRYRELIARLQAEGHEVVFVAREPERAAAVFATDPPRIAAAPRGETPPGRRILFPNSFPEILLNCGFDDADALVARFRLWCALLQPHRPDVLISDYSPSALMAGRALGIPSIVCGSGFYSPPRLRPMPPIRYWLPHDRDLQLAAETRVVSNVNRALAAQGAPPLAALADLYEAPQILMTVPEFDPYPTRLDVRHVGTYADPAFGKVPRWPAGPGPAVFAYLDPGVLLPEILSGLARLGARLCLFAPGLDGAALAALRERPALELMTEPVDLPHAARESALMITNANLNTMVAGLRAGTPQLAVPYNLEKFLSGRRLEESGAGLSAPRRAPGNVHGKLRALLTDPSYRNAANRFAATHSCKTGTDPLQAMYDAVRRCLAQAAVAPGKGQSTP